MHLGKVCVFICSAQIRIPATLQLMPKAVAG
jgi:hypothetical protein